MNARSKTKPSNQKHNHLHFLLISFKSDQDDNSSKHASCHGAYFLTVIVHPSTLISSRFPSILPPRKTQAILTHLHFIHKIRVLQWLFLHFHLTLSFFGGNSLLVLHTELMIIKVKQDIIQHDRIFNINPHAHPNHHTRHLHTEIIA